MPIDTESKEWQNAGADDPLEVKINEILTEDSSKAYSVSEIEELLVEDHPHLFPDNLAGETSVDGAKATRQGIIATILENKYWHSEVSFKFITDDQNADSGLYYTWEGTGFSPIAELDEVKDVDPDSPWGILSSRFKQIEEDFEDDVDDLEDRIAHLEHRIRQEHGRF
jgi:hypothetical protein